MKPKLVRITTVPESLKTLLKGQLRFMSENGYEVFGISSKGVSLSEVKLHEGIEVFEIEMSRKITPFKDLISLFKLIRLIRKLRPNIVHTHTPKAGTLGMLAAKLAGVPVRLHTVAGLPLLEAKGIKRIILNVVEITTYFFATKVYPNSVGLEKIIQKNRFCNSKKIKVLANGSTNGINTSHFNPDLFSMESKLDLKSKLNIEYNDFVFIFVGRLVGDKGINELVTAFYAIQENDKGCKLLLVGNYEDELDPLENNTKKIIENNSNIITVGFQVDVRPFLSIANCLVFPSYREGFPNVVMQAGAMGLPSIVSDINGCNEIIREEINGTIIPVKNTEALIEKMQRVYHDTFLYKKLQINTRKMIVEKYEQKFVWNELLKEYKKFTI
ncbi:MAG: glycosyltransferase family 4 protein [Flavobacterium sp.]|uniref:glycosyltransferase family 4 protein n=1 Tax=Flavobacterium sp. TaxID=239 RepID=UPI003BBBEFBC